MILIVYDGDLRAAGLEKHGRGGDGEHRVIVMDVNVDFTVHSRPELVVVVVEIEFGEQRAVDGSITPAVRHVAREGAIAVIPQGEEVDGLAKLDQGYIRLRDIHINAETVGVGDVEHLVALGGIGEEMRARHRNCGK